MENSGTSRNPIVCVPVCSPDAIALLIPPTLRSTRSLRRCQGGLPDGDPPASLQKTRRAVQKLVTFLHGPGNGPSEPPLRGEPVKRPVVRLQGNALDSLRLERDGDAR